MRELFIKRDWRKEIDQLVNMKMLLTMLMMPMQMTMINDVAFWDIYDNVVWKCRLLQQKP